MPTARPPKANAPNWATVSAMDSKCADASINCPSAQSRMPVNVSSSSWYRV
ncbi:hypothetical protein D3C84_680740 [compost metagenome]